MKLSPFAAETGSPDAPPGTAASRPTADAGLRAPDGYNRGMIRLTREVRFSVDRDWAGHIELSREVTNSWAGWPSAVGVVPFLCLRATVSGAPDPFTGYLCNISRLDRLLREHAIPYTAARLHAHGWRLPAERLLLGIWSSVQPNVPRGATLEVLELATTPFLRYSIRRETPMHVRLTQQFEFSAAHRLHVTRLSDEENRRVFGKCNNPRGHGHNYQFEPRVAVPLSTQGPPAFTHARLTSLCEATLIKPFDHTHLNEDTREFNTALGGLIPSVENIARVFYERLAKALAAEPGSPRLVSMTVWETDRTSATWAPG